MAKLYDPTFSLVGPVVLEFQKAQFPTEQSVRDELARLGCVTRDELEGGALYYWVVSVTRPPGETVAGITPLILCTLEGQPLWELEEVPS